jgi:hypothetical protein
MHEGKRKDSNNARHSKQVDFSQFLWLEGDWIQVDNEGKLQESWRLSGDTMLIGFSSMIQGKDTLFFEKLSIEVRGYSYYYIPEVRDQNNGQAVLFKMTEANPGKFVFENKEHDFPQRIVYTHPISDSLVAWIEGQDRGKFRKEFFRYRKQR